MGADEWVAVSFGLFILLLVYLKVPAMVTKALDDRADRIRDELEAARRLKEEAQSALTEFQHKREEATREAEAIIAQARQEAELYAEETRRNLAEQLERRTRMAEDKIARAEEQATNEVRSAAAEVAIATARELIASRVGTGAGGSELIARGIAELKGKLN
ncbi:MAG: F0F1 ATP synthase subunit B [Rhizobiales bacterium]|nr:F0F1 ATP synthase subunit B [Hyphomicrobiales bacterium]